ncbi:hypothetical protein DSO57_1026571 [Entomophthora muscae]|uniref:Uncharacterized protein n=1 Tax=Entomophthora muscae TaxID=34485 RepID=A0ACC2UBY4_9FUNG|nr:hypothetical protein DSO57_1026571 [Entomophthora muscae]
MPRDKNRSGRRQPRKNGPRPTKEDEHTSSEQAPFNEPERVEEPAQDYGYQGQSELGGRPGDVDPAAFGLVDPDVQHYFKNLERAISGKDFDGNCFVSYSISGLEATPGPLLCLSFIFDI